MPLPNRVRNATRAPVAASSAAHLLADPALVQRHLHQRRPRRTGRASPRRACRRQQRRSSRFAVQRHRGHGRDAEPLVDLGPLGVVDAGDHVRDAERLPGHPGGDDVGVVAAADRREGAGPLDAGPVSVSRSKPMPVTGRRAKSAPSRRNAAGFWSMIATECPARSRLRARLEPTRPQPMTTMCTVSGRYRAIGPPRSARRPPAGYPAAPGRTLVRVAADEGRQAPGDRAAGQQRPARRDRAVQADRAADLRQRRAVLGDVRDAGDPAGAHRRPAPHTCSWRRGWRGASCCCSRSSSRRTGRWSARTRPAAGTTRSPRRTSAGSPGSPWPARCWSTTC